MNAIQFAQNDASKRILAAYRTAVQNGELPDAPVKEPLLEEPRDVKNGDLASSFAMQNAKLLGNPRKTGECIAKYFELSGSVFCAVEVAGAGFINLRYSHGWFEQVLAAIAQMGERYGESGVKTGRRIMVEFVSANPTGPMHIGNARGGVLGDNLATVLSLAGNDSYREFYVNDTGNQIERFGLSLLARYHQIFDASHPFPEDGYFGADIGELAQAFYAQFGDLRGDLTLKERLAEFGLAHNITRMRDDLARYNIEYDNWFSELTLHQSGYIDETIELLTSRGATYEQDGALWLRSTDYGCEKDDVLKRANGVYTYFAADIAYHRDKLARRGFDLAINIWGADHHGHVARLKGALDALGLDGQNRLIIVLMQLVNLMRGGEAVRVSKRTGNAISLSNLLDEIPIDAARYFFSSRVSDSHLDFDLELAARQDSENPVYYVQYVNARIHSILKALAQDGIGMPESPDLSLLTAQPELDLIRACGRFPEEVRLAALGYDPSRICRYVESVAGLFHSFYTSCRIRGAESDALRDARIALIGCTSTVIQNALKCLGVSAPSHM